MPKTMSVFLLFLSAIFLMAAHSCDNATKISPDHYAKETNEILTCTSDDDCTVVNPGCCGCNQGGKQTAISKAAASIHKAKMAQQCKETFCTQVISKHESCELKARCIQGACTL